MTDFDDSVSLRRPSLPEPGQFPKQEKRVVRYQSLGLNKELAFLSSKGRAFPALEQCYRTISETELNSLNALQGKVVEISIDYDPATRVYSYHYKGEAGEVQNTIAYDHLQAQPLAAAPKVHEVAIREIREQQASNSVVAFLSAILSFLATPFVALYDYFNQGEVHETAQAIIPLATHEGFSSQSMLHHLRFLSQCFLNTDKTEHSWISSTLEVLHNETLHIRREKNLFFSATQEAGHICDMAYRLGLEVKKAQAATNSNAKRAAVQQLGLAIRSALTPQGRISSNRGGNDYEWKVEARHQNNRVVIPVMTGEGREATHHLLLIERTENGHADRYTLKHIRQASPSIATSKMNTVTAYDVTAKLVNANLLGDFLHSLINLQPIGKPSVAPPQEGPSKVNLSLDEWLLSQLGPALQNASQKIQKPSDDPVKMLLTMVKELGLTDDAHLAEDGERQLNALVESKARFYEFYVNNLIEFFNQHYETLSSQEAGAFLLAIDAYAQKLYRYLSKEMGASSADYAMAPIRKLLADKKAEVTNIEEREKLANAGLNATVSPFEMRVRFSPAESMRLTEKRSEAKVKEARVLYQDMILVKNLTDTLTHIDLSLEARQDALKSLQNLTGNLSKLLRSNQLLSAKHLSLELLRALPTPVTHARKATFWASLESAEEIDNWMKAIHELCERTWEANLRNGSFPLDPSEAFEFNIVVPLILRCLFSKYNNFSSVIARDTMIKWKLPLENDAPNPHVAIIKDAVNQFVDQRIEEIRVDVRAMMEKRWEEEEERRLEEERTFPERHLSWSQWRTYRALSRSWRSGIGVVHPNAPAGYSWEHPENEPEPQRPPPAKTPQQKEAEFLAEFQNRKRNDGYLSNLKTLLGLDPRGDVEHSNDIQRCQEAFFQNWMQAGSSEAEKRTQRAIGRLVKLAGFTKEELTHIFFSQYGSMKATVMGAGNDDTLLKNWLMTEDFSQLIAADYYVHQRYEGCQAFAKFLVTDITQNHSELNTSSLAEFLIGYDELKSDEDTANRVRSEIEIALAGFSKDDNHSIASLVPPALSLIRRQQEMRGILENPSAQIVPYYSFAIGEIFGSERIDLESAKNSFSTAKCLHLQFAYQGGGLLKNWIGERKKGAYVISESPTSVSGSYCVLDDSTRTFFASTSQRKAYIGNVTPDQVDQRVDGDNEGQVVMNAATQARYGQNSLHSILLSLSSMQGDQNFNEGHDIAFSRLTVGGCFHTIFQALNLAPDLLLEESNLHQIYDHLFQRGLVQENLIKNPHFFIDLAETQIKPMLSYFKQQQNDKHNGKYNSFVVFLLDICEKIKLEAAFLQRKITNNELTIEPESVKEGTLSSLRDIVDSFPGYTNMPDLDITTLYVAEDKQPRQKIFALYLLQYYALHREVVEKMDFKKESDLKRDLKQKISLLNETNNNLTDTLEAFFNKFLATESHSPNTVNSEIAHLREPAQRAFFDLNVAIKQSQKYLQEFETIESTTQVMAALQTKVVNFKSILNDLLTQESVFKNSQTLKEREQQLRGTAGALKAEIVNLEKEVSKLVAKDDRGNIARIMRAYSILQRSWANEGHSGIIANVHHEVQTHILPALQTVLDRADEGERNVFLDQLAFGHHSATPNYWKKGKSYQYVLTLKEGPKVIDFSTGEGISGTLQEGSRDTLPAPIRLNPDYQLLFGNQEFVVDCKEERTIRRYQWQDPRTEINYELFHDVENVDTIQIFQEIKGRRYRFCRIETENGFMANLGGYRQNNVLTDLIRSKGVWIEVDKSNHSIHTECAYVAQHETIEHEPIILYFAGNRIYRACIGEGDQRMWICSGTKEDCDLLPCQGLSNLLILSRDGVHADQIRFLTEPKTKVERNGRKVVTYTTPHLVLKRSEKDSSRWVDAENEEMEWQRTHTAEYEKRFGKHYRQYLLPLKNARTGEERIFIYPYFASKGKADGEDPQLIRKLSDIVALLKRLFPSGKLPGVGGLHLPADIDISDIEQLRGLAALIDKFNSGGPIGNFLSLMSRSDNNENIQGNIERAMGPFAELLFALRPISLQIAKGSHRSSHAGFLYLAHLASLRGDYAAASRYLDLMVKNGVSLTAKDAEQFNFLATKVVLCQLTGQGNIEHSLPIPQTLRSKAFYLKLLISLKRVETQNASFEQPVPVALGDQNLPALGGGNAANVMGMLQQGANTIGGTWSLINNVIGGGAKLLASVGPVASDYRNASVQARKDLAEQGLLLDKSEETLLSALFPIDAHHFLHNAALQAILPREVRAMVDRTEAQPTAYRFQVPTVANVQTFLKATAEHSSADFYPSIAHLHLVHGNQPKIATIVSHFWDYVQWIIYTERPQVTMEDLTFLMQEIPASVSDEDKVLINTGRSLLLKLFHYKRGVHVGSIKRNKLTDIQRYRKRMVDLAQLEIELEGYRKAQTNGGIWEQIRYQVFKVYVQGRKEAALRSENIVVGGEELENQSLSNQFINSATSFFLTEERGFNGVATTVEHAVIQANEVGQVIATFTPPPPVAVLPVVAAHAPAAPAVQPVLSLIERKWNFFRGYIKGYIASMGGIMAMALHTQWDMRLADAFVDPLKPVFMHAMEESSKENAWETFVNEVGIFKNFFQQILGTNPQALGFAIPGNFFDDLQFILSYSKQPKSQARDLDFRLRPELRMLSNNLFNWRAKIYDIHAELHPKKAQKSAATSAALPILIDPCNTPRRLDLWNSHFLVLDMKKREQIWNKRAENAKSYFPSSLPLRDLLIEEIQQAFSQDQHLEKLAHQLKEMVSAQPNDHLTQEEIVETSNRLTKEIRNMAEQDRRFDPILGKMDELAQIQETRELTQNDVRTAAVRIFEITKEVKRADQSLEDIVRLLSWKKQDLTSDEKRSIGRKLQSLGRGSLFDRACIRFPSKMEQHRNDCILRGIDVAQRKLSERCSRSLSIMQMKALKERLDQRFSELNHEIQRTRTHILDFARSYAQSLGLLPLYGSRGFREEEIIDELINLYRDEKLGCIGNVRLQNEIEIRITHFLLASTEYQQLLKAKGVFIDMFRLYKRAKESVENQQSGTLAERREDIQWELDRDLDWLLMSTDLRNFLIEGSNRLRYSQPSDDGHATLDNPDFTRSFLVEDFRKAQITRQKQKEALLDIEKGKRFIKVRMGVGKSSFIFPRIVDRCLKSKKNPVLMTTDELLPQLRQFSDERAYVLAFDINYGLSQADTEGEAGQVRVQEHLSHLISTLEALPKEGRYVLTTPSRLAAVENMRKKLQESLLLFPSGNLTPPQIQKREVTFDILQQIKKIEAFFNQDSTVYFQDEDVNLNISFDFNFAIGTPSTVNPVLYSMAEVFVITLLHNPQYQTLLNTNTLRSVSDIKPMQQWIARQIYRNTALWQSVGWTEWETYKNPQQDPPSDKENQFVAFVCGLGSEAPSFIAWPQENQGISTTRYHHIAALKQVITRSFPSVFGVHVTKDRGIRSENGVTIVPYSDGIEKDKTQYGEEGEFVLHHLLHYAWTHDEDDHALKARLFQRIESLKGEGQTEKAIDLDDQVRELRAEVDKTHRQAEVERTNFAKTRKCYLSEEVFRSVYKEMSSQQDQPVFAMLSTQWKDCLRELSNVATLYRARANAEIEKRRRAGEDININETINDFLYEAYMHPDCWKVRLAMLRYITFNTTHIRIYRKQSVTNSQDVTLDRYDQVFVASGTGDPWSMNLACDPYEDTTSEADDVMGETLLCLYGSGNRGLDEKVTIFKDPLEHMKARMRDPKCIATLNTGYMVKGGRSEKLVEEFQEENPRFQFAYVDSTTRNRMLSDQNKGPQPYDTLHIQKNKLKAVYGAAECRGIDIQLPKGRDRYVEQMVDLSTDDDTSAQAFWRAREFASGGQQGKLSCDEKMARRVRELHGMKEDEEIAYGHLLSATKKKGVQDKELYHVKAAIFRAKRDLKKAVNSVTKKPYDLSLIKAEEKPLLATIERALFSVHRELYILENNINDAYWKMQFQPETRVNTLEFLLNLYRQEITRVNRLQQNFIAAMGEVATTLQTYHTNHRAELEGNPFRMKSYESVCEQFKSRKDYLVDAYKTIEKGLNTTYQTFNLPTLDVVSAKIKETGQQLERISKLAAEAQELIERGTPNQDLRAQMQIVQEKATSLSSHFEHMLHLPVHDAGATKQLIKELTTAKELYFTALKKVQDALSSVRNNSIAAQTKGQIETLVNGLNQNLLILSFYPHQRITCQFYLNNLPEEINGDYSGNVDMQQQVQQQEQSQEQEQEQQQQFSISVRRGDVRIENPMNFERFYTNPDRATTEHDCFTSLSELRFAQTVVHSHSREPNTVYSSWGYYRTTSKELQLPKSCKPYADLRFGKVFISNRAVALYESIGARNLPLTYLLVRRVPPAQRDGQPTYHSCLMTEADWRDSVEPALYAKRKEKMQNPGAGDNIDVVLFALSGADVRMRPSTELMNLIKKDLPSQFQSLSQAAQHLGQELSTLLAKKIDLIQNDSSMDQPSKNATAGSLTYEVDLALEKVNSFKVRIDEFIKILSEKGKNANVVSWCKNLVSFAPKLRESCEGAIKMLSQFNLLPTEIEPVQSQLAIIDKKLKESEPQKDDKPQKDSKPTEKAAKEKETKKTQDDPPIVRASKEKPPMVLDQQLALDSNGIGSWEMVSDVRSNKEFVLQMVLTKLYLNYTVFTEKELLVLKAFIKEEMTKEVFVIKPSDVASTGMTLGHAISLLTQGIVNLDKREITSLISRTDNSQDRKTNLELLKEVLTNQHWQCRSVLDLINGIEKEIVEAAEAEKQHKINYQTQKEKEAAEAIRKKAFEEAQRAQTQHSPELLAKLNNEIERMSKLSASSSTSSATSDSFSSI